ncbi:MAG: DUF3800 domain-containing protein [Mangrovibacterium sp.]
MKTFNIYCDESCHLENDHKDYMLLGCVSCAYNQVQLHTKFIKELKQKHNLYGEIKWSKVSSAQFDFYKELLHYFFATDLKYRAVIVNKSKIDNDGYQQDFDMFYYKMYYQLLNHNKNSEYSYNVYLDIKDTLSATKVNTLKDILNIKYGVFRNVQNIRSHESAILQLADLITGALAYNLNNADKKVEAKQKLIGILDKHAPKGLTQSSNYADDKMNLFFIELK